MMSRRRLLALSTLSPLAFSLSAQEQPPDEKHPAETMATVGIAAGQLARLSLFHHDVQGIDPCAFEAVLVDVGGKKLAGATGKLMPGQGAYVDFDLAAELRKGERVQVHANVLVPEGHANHVGGTLEVFDVKTRVTAMSVRPCGVLAEMGTVGVVAGQTARLSVFHHADQGLSPCGYRIDILGLDGKLLGSDGGKVLPGQGAFHDYDLAAGLRHDERVQFHAMVRMPVGHSLGALVEIFDAKTGVTAFGVVPCGIEDASL